MNIEKIINKLRSNVDNDFKDSELSMVVKSLPPLNLNNLVDEFINWCKNNMIQSSYIDNESSRIQNFIEKMAVWYELRYPDYEVNRLMHCCSQQETNVSNVMFNENEYINAQLDADSEVRILDWADFYNTRAFINSLSDEERVYLARPKYISLVYWDEEFGSHVHLTANGLIDAEVYMKVNGENLSFKGKNIKDIVKKLKELNYPFPESCGFEEAIRDYDNQCYFKEELLNCVMYRIIERGSNRIGPRRAFLFAKEFNRNIDIPMIYGIEPSDPGLDLFIENYLAAGGSKNLICFDNSFYRKMGCYENVESISLAEIYKRIKNGKSFYNPMEKEFYQKLVNVLSSPKLAREKIQEARLERKLTKSRIRSK